MSLIPWWSENSRENPVPAGMNELFWTHQNTIDLVWWGGIGTLRLVFRDKTRKFRVEITTPRFKGIVYLKPNGSPASASPFSEYFPAMLTRFSEKLREDPDLLRRVGAAGYVQLMGMTPRTRACT